jgi:hypothetical protein
MIAIFDIDGVLADNSLTRDLDCTDPAQAAEFAEMIKTATALPACDILRSLAAAGAQIYIFTARSKFVRQQTENWLFDNTLPYRELLMRQPNNNWRAWALKEGMLISVKQAMEGVDYGQIIAFEDCPRTAKMYEENGVKTFLACNLKEMLKW